MVRSRFHVERDPDQKLRPVTRRELAGKCEVGSVLHECERLEILSMTCRERMRTIVREEGLFHALIVRVALRGCVMNAPDRACGRWQRKPRD